MILLLLLGAATAGFPPVPPAIPRTTNTVALVQPAQPAPAPEPLPTHYGPSGEVILNQHVAPQASALIRIPTVTNIELVAVQTYPDMRVLYPKPHRSGTNGLHLIFEHVDTTNACTLQTRSAMGDWQDFGKPWVPQGKTSLFVTNDTQYRLLVPVTPKRKQE